MICKSEGWYGFLLSDNKIQMVIVEAVTEKHAIQIETSMWSTAVLRFVGNHDDLKHT
jgi:hypothetical protein